MKVTLIASTRFFDESARTATKYQYTPAGNNGQDLVEFAGRACYDSWRRPNPETATNEGYLENIIDHAHFSVLEHASVSFYITEVSRSLTHELVRHRHHSPSQLSQRFVALDKDSTFVTPPLFEGDADAGLILQEAWDNAVHAYENLVTIGERRVAGMVSDHGKTMARKRVREAARAVLPNMTPTAVVLTGNHRAWRDFLTKRGEAGVDLEFRRLTEEIFKHLKIEEPNIYQDFFLVPAPDGFSMLVGRGYERA